MLITVLSWCNWMTDATTLVDDDNETTTRQFNINRSPQHQQQQGNEVEVQLKSEIQQIQQQRQQQEQVWQRQQQQREERQIQQDQQHNIQQNHQQQQPQHQVQEHNIHPPQRHSQRQNEHDIQRHQHQQQQQREMDWQLQQQQQQQQQQVQRQQQQRHHELQQQQQQQKSQLSKSLASTFAALSEERPDQMEEEAIQRAMELSMLDVALVYHKGSSSSSSSSSIFDALKGNNQRKSPYQILGVSPNATEDSIRSAYRKLARTHHPDKGGDSNQFQAIACAYRSLLSGGSNHQRQQQEYIKGTAHWDKQLQDHRKLVQELFQADGMDVQASLRKQSTVLDMLGLQYKDVGSTNRNEQNELIYNSCFYLSLAASYLLGIGAITSTYFTATTTQAINDEEESALLVGETALQLKRTIESAVVKAHPEWAAQGMVGEQVQAFSDFLVYTLDSPTLLSDWAVVVFDSCSGFCDVYKGRNYNIDDNSNDANTTSMNDDNDDDDDNEKWSQSNTITLRYIPGHYQPLIPINNNVRRPNLRTILSTLDDVGVFYVVTDGNS